MADTGEEPGDGNSGELAVADPVLERLEDRVASERLALARDFGRAVLRRVPAEQFGESDPEALADEIASAFAFIDEREPGELAIRSLNPQVAVDGWSDPGTVIEVCVEDRPFLLSTINTELSRAGYEVVRSFHPILGVERDDDGRITAFRGARHAAQREAIVHVELDAQLSEGEREEMESTLRAVLQDVLAATDDFDPMRERVRAVIEKLRTAAARGTGVKGMSDKTLEAAAFLEWLLDDNFVFLASRMYDVTVRDGHRWFAAREDSDLGVLAGTLSRYEDPTPVKEADEGVRHRHGHDPVLHVVRSHRMSTVHRHVRMLNVWAKIPSEDGDVVAELRLLGLFTRKAYSEPSSTIPVLRTKLDSILEREDIVEDSHDERTFVSLFEAIPEEELFELDLEELRETILGLVAAEERLDVRLFTRVDYFTRTVTAILAVPRDRYDASLRRSVQRLLLDRFDGSGVDVGLSLSERPEAVVRFAIHVDGEIPEVSPDALEAEVRELCRSWRFDLEQALVERLGEAEGHHLYRRYGVRLPQAYRNHTPVERAVEDVLLIDDMLGRGDELRMVVHDDPIAEQSLSRVKILKAGEGIELSGILPILESLGLTVTEELPFRLSAADAWLDDTDIPELHIHDYGVHVTGQVLDAERDGPRIADAVTAARKGRLEIDSLNRLVLTGRLEWPWVVVLRAYRRYRRQVGTAYTAEYQNDALVSYVPVARALVDLFDARFNPDRGADEEELRAYREEVVSALDGVERLDHDRILRAFLHLIDATVRTNRYASDGDERVTLKFDSSRVPQLPKPVPYREIFVYTPAVEAIHLRGGRIARGGIRWSDRRDDLRTEILDLMRAQMLKNAVIVPAGAKGGFVLKRPGDDLRADIERQYRTFMSSLLEITDNVVSGEVRAPTNVRRREEDDPYLVVAADRGTATLSDTANEIAADHDYWLDDAFASGGSEGYDHKRLGITARGAWVAVQRHFRELGVDVQSEPVSVVGIGDMSGDVFGNGMLQSRAIELVAAFDHRDIFLDPSPDAERAFQERERLFADPSLTWQDYDRDLISDGGGVWSRTEKRIRLSEAVRERLHIEDEALSPPELVRALLTAPVDLLFAGGIGTFVKASHETHDDIGDRVNDEVRVDATALRARVVGEGANLSITPHARVQYARRGGRLNADFIDNSAGVDISDHEVNLKILLGLAADQDELAEGERTELLFAVTEDVVQSCLRDVELQTWRLTQEAVKSPDELDTYESLVSTLSALDLIDRETEALPSTEEMIERAEVGAGLSRPELAVLLAAEKRHLFTDLIDSDLPDQRGLRSALEEYFPPRFVSRFDPLLDEHPLRRELVATVVANDVVNRMGVTFVRRVARELGIPAPRIIAAYRVARGVADAPTFWAAAERLDALDPTAGMRAKEDIDALLDAMTRAYLRSSNLDDIAGAVAADRPAFEALDEAVTSRMGTTRSWTQHAEELVDAGLTTDDAARLAGVSDLAVAPDVASVARSVGRDAQEIAAAFLEVGDSLALPRLQRFVGAIEPADQWERWQHRGLLDDIRALHRVAAHRALQRDPELDGTEAVEHFVAARRDEVEHARRLVRQIETDDDAPPLAAAQVALRAVRDALRERARP